MHITMCSHTESQQKHVPQSVEQTNSTHASMAEICITYRIAVPLDDNLVAYVSGQAAMHA